MAWLGKKGFTLIELVMVILLLAILAAVALPTFQDFRTEAKNAAVQGALGGIRTAVAVARAAIALQEDTTVAVYPTYTEMKDNAYSSSHPVLVALPNAHQKAIMDMSVGIPFNAWSTSSVLTTKQNSIHDCLATKGAILTTPAVSRDFGWCYKQTSGEVWANTDNNGGGAGAQEHNY